MFDNFGSFEALAHGWRMFMHGKRGTGRTTAMIEKLQEGDLVVVNSGSIGSHLKRACKDAGFTIETYVAPSNYRCHELYDRLAGKSKQRIMFDHTWVECFIADRIEDMREEFEHLNKKLLERQLEIVTMNTKNHSGEYNAHIIG